MVKFLLIPLAIIPFLGFSQFKFPKKTTYPQPLEVALLNQSKFMGKITDEETGESLPFINITLEKNGVQITNCQSNFDGDFSTSPIPPGEYIVKFTSISFEDHFHKFSINGSTKYFYDCRMVSSSIELASCTFISSCCFSISYTEDIDSVIITDLFTEHDRIENSQLDTLPNSLQERSFTPIHTFPNPATNFITISHLEDVIQLEIIHISGQVLKSLSHINATEIQLDISTFQTGIFFIRYHVTDQIHMHKFIKY